VVVVSEILEVDLLAFERGDASKRNAVIDGVRRSLETGFVLTRHDLSEDMLDTAYGMLREFFTSPLEQKQRWNVPGAHGQTGYTGVLVETAASSDEPDWKEMLNWSTPIDPGHPLKRKFPAAYPDQVLPEGTVPGITKVLYEFHDTIAELQRRFLRVVAAGIGCHESFFDEMVDSGPTLTRAIRYPPMTEVPESADGTTKAAHVWAAEHGDINLITALPRATAPGLQVKVDGEWVDAVAPEGQVIINTGIMLERLTNGQIGTASSPRRATKASATASSSSATRGPGRSCRRFRAAVVPNSRNGSTPCRRPTRSTRCSTRSTSSRTPAG
jgi:isopenicillin N synthase-like dioxygenase